jgi:hypothetical protein
MEPVREGPWRSLLAACVRPPLHAWLRHTMTFLDLSPVLIPVVVSLAITAGSAWAVRRYAGPAQIAYQTAVQGRLTVLSAEREELVDKVKDLTIEVDRLGQVIETLRDKVGDLERQLRDLTSENLMLRRQIAKQVLGNE